ncbi:uncharacterized protein AB675_8600 [Cyphellophora attinorum]|uniref:Uncharacterized protein n=1 Tax=Cyphellophora attinorum TaxID=1664694 RepID=A0A0N1HZT7_9EURO|nr:uncharacterized protein AB675_8600 [Phialophora attinorum]KPI44445.1 hypothetical protein AB675_8600 [Phialophora attinorum]
MADRIVANGSEKKYHKIDIPPALIRKGRTLFEHLGYKVDDRSLADRSGDTWNSGVLRSISPEEYYYVIVAGESKQSGAAVVVVAYAGRSDDGYPLSLDDKSDLLVVFDDDLQRPQKYFAETKLAIKTAGSVLLPTIVHSVGFEKMDYQYQLHDGDGPELSEKELDEIVDHVISY